MSDELPESVTPSDLRASAPPRFQTPSTSDLSAWLASTWSEAIRDHPDINVWQFAKEHIVFDAKMGNITGPWREDLTPYTKLFQEAITSHFVDVPEEDWFLRALIEKGQRVDETFVVKSSQSGFTQGTINGVFYIPLHDPGRLLYAILSREKAKSVTVSPMTLIQCRAGWK